MADPKERRTEPGGRAERLAAKLEREIADGRHDSSGGLPSIRQLSRRWQASKTTVSRVMHILAQRGVIDCPVNQHGYRIRGRKRLPPARAGRTFRHESIAAIVQARIVDGTYPCGEPIPVAKVLRREFGCARSTLQAALNALSAARLIVRRGRGFIAAVSAGVAVRGASHVYLASDPGLLNAPQTGELIAGIERELALRGWNPVKYLLARHPLAGPADPASPPAGYIFVKVGIIGEWEKFFRALPRIPLVAIDEAERLTWTANTFNRHSRFCGIAFDNRRAGQEVATSLLERGHKRVAFIGHLPVGKGWTRLRLDGLRDILGDGGGRQGVVSFTPQGSVAAGNGEFVRRVAALRKGFGAQGIAPAAMLEERFGPLFSLACSIDNAAALEPLFASALADASLTAWVCINDEIAALAWEFLRRNRRVVPRDISLVGFDGSPLAHRMQLASYHFGYDRAGACAVRCLAEWDTMPRAKDGYVRVVGREVPGMSVGDAGH